MSDGPPTKHGLKYTPQVLAQCVTRFKQLRRNPHLEMLEACKIIGEEFTPPIPTNSVYKIIDRFRPTNMLASDYLRSKAFRMAKRLVKEADAGQLIDLLSRSSMGVVAPKTAPDEGQRGFFLSVQAESCGAVRVGVATGSTARELPAHTGDEYAADDPWRDERVQRETAPQRFLEGQGGDESEAGSRHRYLRTEQAEGRTEGLASGRGDSGRQDIETADERRQRLIASAKARIDAARRAQDAECAGVK